MKQKNSIFQSLIFLMAMLSLDAQNFTLLDNSMVGFDKVTKNNGVALADYDLDGDLDVFFTGYYSFDPEDGDTWNRLMQNDGNGKFTDVTIEAGFTNQFVNTEVIASLGEKMGVSWGDYDNDGYPDLFLTNSRLDQLYHNEGDGTFKDVTEEAGVAGCHTCYSGGATWFDHDRDGDLDIYVANLKGRNFLYENLGDGTFQDIALLVGAEGYEFSVTWTAIAIDEGRDGFLDIYTANDTQINEFFENRSGTHYNESARAYRLANDGAGMGLSVGDFNNDGHYDIYVTNIYNHLPNALFQNLGTRRFEDVAVKMGVENAGWSWGTKFFDYDLDGDEDLMAVNGVVSKQYIYGIEQEDIKNKFYKNMFIENGLSGFDDYSQHAALDGEARARGMEVFDYDLDGDLDILVANVEQEPYLYINNTISAPRSDNPNWVQIQLEGVESNRSAFGTEVIVSAGNQTFYRWHHGAGFFGQSIMPVHVGLGHSDHIDSISVKWLSGQKDVYTNIAPNQVLKIVEGQSITTPVKPIKDADNLEVMAWPNPFHQNVQFRIRSEKTDTGIFKVFTSSGIEVYQQNIELFPGDTRKVVWTESGSMDQGLYFYIYSSDNQIYSGKLIKQ